MIEEIRKIATSNGASLTEKKGVFTFEKVVAERKAFLSKKRLTYIARFRLDETEKEIIFTEMLKESGMGLSSGDSDISAGWGFKKESYKTGSGPREGTIQEQSALFGKDYSYRFDFGAIRGTFEAAAARAGWRFTYKIISIGL
jgi:hypothetical protein